MSRKPRSAGLEFANVANISEAVRRAHDRGYGFIVAPVVHPRLYRSKFRTSGEAWVRTDLVLSGSDWQDRVIPKVSPWMDTESPVASNRAAAREILLQELSWFHHLGCKAVIIELKRRNNAHLIRTLCSQLHQETSTFFKEFTCQKELWLQVPTTSKKTMAAAFRSDLPDNDDGDDNDDPWHWWNDARLSCESHNKVKVALELTADLPEESKLSRWLGEPVEVVIFPTHVFLTNNKGYPTLSKAHQKFVQKLAWRNIPVVVSGVNRHSAYKYYLQYINHLYQTAVLPDHLATTSGCEDTIQIPLQPLADHLESYTYEVFEKDPVKYSEYGTAIYQALLDRVPDSEAETTTQVIMVVGAGRGPLVSQAVLAARKANRKVRVYALDKNPNAHVTLTDLKREVWGDVVEVVLSDMRKWDAPEKCDILVSELLGSFGDNELSPECLDGAQVFLKDDGISIPESYRSYLQPTMSMRLYNEVRDVRIPYKPDYFKFEHVYVVAQTNTYSIAPTKQLFEFVHPNRSEEIDNDRWKTLSWTASEDSTLHGFSGYFDTTLYKDIKLSIHPETFSVGMFSWFPIYVPISEPISVKAGDVVTVDFWRLHNDRRVWYEWQVTAPARSCIYNINGRSSTIGL